MLALVTGTGGVDLAATLPHLLEGGNQIPMTPNTLCRSLEGGDAHLAVWRFLLGASNSIPTGVELLGMKTRIMV